MFRTNLPSEEAVGEERGILREGDQELNAPEVETTIHKLQSTGTDQQGRAALVPGQHVPEDQAYRLPRGFRKDRDAGVFKNSPKIVRCI